MTATDFQRESHRIDQLIWDAMSLTAGERVLFCGYANDAAWVRRAAAIGVDVHVIESDETQLAELAARGLMTLRGSTTMIPARDASFDAVVAFHYLHEIDPTFHTQIVSELARVAKRMIVVEPAPPADPLGKRISELYSRAKFEAGAFEEYQPIEYWRKLLAMVRAEVLMEQFTFTRLAPRFAIEETVALILEAMAIEEMPEGYLDELRELARSPDAQLTPLSRFVLVGAPAGRPIRASAGTLFREPTGPQDPLRAAAIVSAAVAATAAARAAADGAPAADASPVVAPASFAAAMADSEFPPVLPPPVDLAARVPAPAAAAPAIVPPVLESPFGAPAADMPASGPPETAFGAPPARSAPPFGTPFALPDDPDPFGLAPPDHRAGFGWTWEPPDDQALGDADSAEYPFDASDPFGTNGADGRPRG